MPVFHTKWLFALALAAVAGAVPPQDCARERKQAQDLITARSYAAVLPVLQDAIGSCPAGNDLPLALAKAHMMLGDFGAALSAISELLKAAPDDVPALVTKGQILYLMGNAAESKTTLQRAIELAPEGEEGHYWLGRVLRPIECSGRAR